LPTDEETAEPIIVNNISKRGKCVPSGVTSMISRF